MAIEVKHTTQAVGTDAGNGEIAKAQWNEAHTISMATGKLLGRSTAGTGAVEEIALGLGLSLTAGTLSASGYVTGDAVYSARLLSAPDWLPADGRPYLQSSYPALYALLGQEAMPNAPSSVLGAATNQFGGSAVRGAASNSTTAVIVGDSGKIATTTTGFAYTAQSSGVATALNAVCFGNGLFVAVGSSGVLLTSSDGASWTARTSSFGTTAINAIAYAAGTYVAVGEAGKVATSPNATTWTQRTSGFSASWPVWGVAYGNGVFVAVASNNQIRTSPDGITWTSRTSAFAAGVRINAVTYGNGLFVAVTSAGLLATSPDGVYWALRTSGHGTAGILGVIYGAGVFLALGILGVITRSTNGVDWVAIPNTWNAANAAHTGVLFKALFIVAGSTSTLSGYGAIGTQDVTTQFVVPELTRGPLLAYVKT